MKQATGKLLSFVLAAAMTFVLIGWLGAGEANAEEGPDRKVFVSADYVEANVGSDGVVIAEVSWGPNAPDKLIPGAIHVNTDDIESNGQDDGYELWDLRDAQHDYKILMDTLAKKYGITKDTTLICYGTTGSDSAPTRLAMAALMLGVEHVKVLDGGFAKWDGETAAASQPIPAESFGLDAPAHKEWIVSTEQLIAGVESDTLIPVSIRSYDEFIGKNSGYAYIDKAGEPKGAIWGRDTDDGSYLKDDGTVVGYDTLTAFIQDYDPDFNPENDENLAFYCGTGWRATIPFLIAYQAGKDNMKLWDDGWYVYCGAYADPFNWVDGDPTSKKPVVDYPVQLGDPKKGNVEYSTTSKIGAKYNPLGKLAAKSDSVTLAPGTYDSNFEILPPKNNINDSLVYTSSDESVAKVDASGKVTVPAGAAVGKEALITATTNATFGSTPEKAGEHHFAAYWVVVAANVQDGQKATVGGSTYTVTSAGALTATFTKANNAKSVTVPATVVINGKTLAVTGIAPKAFKGTKTKTLTIKTKNLSKKSVKNSLKGSKVKTVKVKVGNKKTNKKYVKKYKKIFTKKNAGKKVSIK